MTRIVRIHMAVGAVLALVAAPAGAASRFTVRGAGYGHGVGMSQWGAYGYAMHGFAYRDILGHYYTGTAIGTSATKDVRVLLQGSVAVARFTGARSAGGRKLNQTRTYGARRSRVAGMVDLLSPRNRVLRRVPAPLVVRAGTTGAILVRGRAGNGVVSGLYRGTLQISPLGSLGVQVVNALGLEDYVRGVVAFESPASWPLEALKAQAVAARTYAITTTRAGTFDQYPDTRSQMYGGVSAEHDSTNAAVDQTAGEVVTYAGEPVVTYFFSTSGGKTENIENTSLGTEPEPWLKSVDDPYDDASPKHRWGPIRMTLSRAGSKLRGLVKGSFEGIEVVKRGASPRIVAADIVGSDGDTRVNGATLRARLGLYDTWAYFTSITSGDEPTDQEVDGDPQTGGTPTPEARAASLMRHRLAGRVVPRRAGVDVTIQQHLRSGWVVVGTAQTTRGGRYAFAAERPGLYRVRFRGDAGPAVRLR